jgi:hypothetical protein
MNLFRSEEHIRNWGRYDPATEEGILSLEDLVKFFSGNFFRKRLDSDYVSRSQAYFDEWLSAVSEFAKIRPFWRRGPHK